MPFICASTGVIETGASNVCILLSVMLFAVA
jgi:hypothetical protein